MGMADGFTIVAENGIMQRRTPDVIRSRTMAAFEAVLSFGLAIAYLLAGPVLTAVGPQGGYIVGGLTAATAAVALIPLLALRREALPVEAGGGPQIRYTSAEGLDGEAVPVTERGPV
jgi:MFS family permease